MKRQAPDGDPLEMRPGEYRRARDSNDKRCAVCCPSCGHRSSLGHLHEIGVGGMVTPSYVCTHDGCTFHEYVVLDGYDET
jgi:hypothetical protein